MKVAIIPARGGSKRLPKKNILPILGRPMLSYPIKSAIKSKMFEKVIVSTEDSEIMTEAQNYGAETLSRPLHLAKDRSTVAQVCLHVLDVLRGMNIVPEYFCCLYATAVFITPDDIVKSFRKFSEEPTADVVMGISEYHLHPMQAMEERHGFLNPKWPEYTKIQSQFFPKLVASNGTLYWARTNSFNSKNSFYVRRLKGYFINRFRAIDINTEEDLFMARCIAKNLPKFL